MEHFGNRVNSHPEDFIRLISSSFLSGELRYQQELERSNPKAFRALLERNGIKYDPNYVRGGWNGD